MHENGNGKPRPFVEDWRRAVMASDLPNATKVVAVGFAFHMASDGTGSRPGIGRLMTETGNARSTVKAGRRALVVGGWLSLVTAGGSSMRGRKANEYRAVIPPDPVGIATRSVSRPGLHDVRDPVAIAAATRSTGGPKVVINEVDKGGGAASPANDRTTPDAADLLATPPNDSLRQELTAKVDALARAYGAPVVHAAIGGLLAEGRRYDWPSRVADAIARTVRATPPGLIDLDGPAPARRAYDVDRQTKYCGDCEAGHVFLPDGTTTRCQCIGGPLAPFPLPVGRDDYADPPPSLPTRPPDILRAWARPVPDMPPDPDAPPF